MGVQIPVTFVFAFLVLAQEDLWAEMELVEQQCLAEAESRYGAITSSRVPSLKRIHTPDLETPPNGRHRGPLGAWIGVVLVSPGGVVARVWTVKELAFKPPWPEFTVAIEEQWLETLYEPRGVSLCMTVTMNVCF